MFVQWKLKFNIFIIIYISLSTNTSLYKLIDKDEKTPFTLDEYLNNTFSGQGWNGSWLTDSTFVYQTLEQNIYKFDMTKKTPELLLNASVLQNYPDASVAFSPDELFVLIKYNTTTIFRYSRRFLCAIYDVQTNKYHDLNHREPVQLAAFSKTGHHITYVYQNNIYYVDPNNLDKIVNVTVDGQIGTIFNGIPDWVYEEEVISSDSTLWHSPDGKYLTYVKFNDTDVRPYFFEVYGEPGNLEFQYPRIVSVRYPKAGTPNPVVTIHLFNIENQTTTEFNLLEKIDNDYIFYDLSWINNHQVVIVSTNRIQNESLIIRCNLDGSCTKETSYKQPNGWIDIKKPIYNENGTKRLQILPVGPIGNYDYFDHLVYTDVSSNTAVPVTSGERVITNIFGWDEKHGIVYYGSSLNNTPSQQHVHSFNLNNGEDKCLTCTYLVDSQHCKYASASFSKSFSYFTKICLGPNPQYVEIQNLKNEADTVVWEDNKDIREQLHSKMKIIRKDLLVPVGDYQARARLHLPHNFDENRKYPTIVEVYAGPDTVSINDRYSEGIENYFVTNKEYIYIFIDGSGSGRDGQNKMFAIYKKLGTLEIEDQITVTKYLQECFPFIDRNNTGIWGWSYGGFASTWALIKDKENIFKFALAVAPVTNFIYYDSIYTERYMGLPTKEDNLIGYNNTDATLNVDGIRGKLYFLIHGNADDNVHYQQSMLMSRALEEADISFRQQSYPDENHSLRGVRAHLYHTIDDFFSRAIN